MKYDIIILGAGPAGMTAAIYSARYGMKTLLISKDIGGTANWAHKIENYPGFEGKGEDLMKKFYAQAKKFGAEFLNDEAMSIKKEKDLFEVYTASEKKFTGKSLILCHGSKRKTLNIKGEEEFLGKGVSTCVTCDGRFFKDKIVAVIGAGNSAAHSSLILADIAKKVYFIYREKIKCDEIILKKIKKKENVELVNAAPVEIVGKDSVEKLVLESNGKKKEINLDGVFAEIGSLPSIEIAMLLGIKIDDKGYILVNENMETNAQGVFAAGDVVKSNLKQVIVAAAQGALAARSANDYLINKSG